MKYFILSISILFLNSNAFAEAAVAPQFLLCPDIFIDTDPSMPPTAYGFGPARELSEDDIGTALKALIEHGLIVNSRIFQRRNSDYDAIIAQALNSRNNMNDLYDALFRRFNSIPKALRHYELENPTTQTTQINSQNQSPARPRPQPAPATRRLSPPPPEPVAPPSTLTRQQLTEIIKSLIRRSYIPFGYFMMQPPAVVNEIVTRMANQPMTTADIFHHLAAETGMDYWKALKDAGLAPELIILRRQRTATNVYSHEEFTQELRRYTSEILQTPLANSYSTTVFTMIVSEAPTEMKPLVSATLQALLRNRFRGIDALTEQVNLILNTPTETADVERALVFLMNNRSLLSFLGL